MNIPDAIEVHHLCIVGAATYRHHGNAVLQTLRDDQILGYLFTPFHTRNYDKLPCVRIIRREWIANALLADPTNALNPSSRIIKALLYLTLSLFGTVILNKPVTKLLYYTKDYALKSELINTECGEDATRLETTDSGRNTDRRHLVIAGIALVVITLAVYIRAGHFQFINFDDNLYVTKNPHVAGGFTTNNIVWAFTTFDYSYWHPITWLSHMADVQLFGMKAGGHHLTNVVIHTLSSLLVLITLFRMTGALWQSSFIAALFALHPMHVESVAWVAERKDVLCALFWFLTIIAYAEFTKRRKPALYVLSLFSFILGLMSKPMIVTLPLVMLLMDFWPLNRFQGMDDHPNLSQRLRRRLPPLIIEKIPFFACSLLSGIVTIYGQYRFGAMSDLTVFPLRLRMENALVAYIRYIIKTIWPLDLAVFYPFPPSLPLWQVITSLAALLSISVAALRVARQRPYVPVGWFWFLITLVPVIGLTQVGNQSMADRFSYIPGTGLFMIVAWGFSDMTKGLRRRERILTVLASAVIVASAALTWRQIGYWRDSVTLYRHSLQVTSGNNLIYGNLGAALVENGEMDAAIQAMREAIRINPLFVDGHHNLGIALAEKGELDAAIREYQVALGISPNDARLHYNLGIALAGKGDLASAIRELQVALRISPNDWKAYYNLGRVLVRIGDLDAAIRQFKEAVRLSPYDLNSYLNLGIALAEKGDVASAIQAYREALRVSPTSKDAHNNLGVALTGKGDLEGAISEFQAILRLAPNDVDAHSNLGVAFASKGDMDAAIREFQEVLRINPNDSYAQSNLARALSQKRMNK
ncbi:MAG TPA: tetratricopeptide repeat protein [Desulfuromonadaceae bacterium]